MSDIKQTLEQRNGQHGEFKNNSRVTEEILTSLKTGVSYELLTPEQKTSLFFISHKAARIVCGDPNHKDHWHDIAGYATLIDNSL